MIVADFRYIIPLYYLDSPFPFPFSSVYHDLLEDDGWVVRSEGEGVDAIGSSRLICFILAFHEVSVRLFP